MPLPVKLQDVIDALETTSDFHAYFLDRRNGEIEMIPTKLWSVSVINIQIGKSARGCRMLSKAKGRFADSKTRFRISEFRMSGIVLNGNRLKTWPWSGWKTTKF